MYILITNYTYANYLRTITRLCASHVIGTGLLESILTKDFSIIPDDQLLCWHFWQAVLTNMKGTGEPVFEQDFPPGSDIVGSILKGPKAASRWSLNYLVA
jgi:hypothetical protein